LGVRLALVLGFATVFGLWLAWGYQLLQNLERIQHNVTGVQESYVGGEQVLVKVRTNVLLGSIYLRDALIDNESTRREYYRSELNRLRDEIEAPLSVYLRDAAPEEREQWARLETELREYWASREMAFTDDAHTPTEAYLLLRRRVVPKRDGVLQIVDQLSALQSTAHQRQQNDTNALYDIVRARVVLIGAATLVGALFVALFVSRHVNRLQHKVERQREGEQQLRRDLERLSAGLVEIQEQERREIARELHDAVGQALTAIKMDIGVALRTTLTERTRAALDEAKEVTETALQGVRDLSQLLHPSTLDDFGLPDTLRTYLNRFSERTGIRAQIVDALPDRLPSDVEACVYRIVQEALNNVARHSGASVCMVSLSIDGGRLRVFVDDNGCGPQETIGAVRGHGLGMIAMRERAQAQGGSFAIAPLPGGGTRVDVSMAVPPTPHERRQELQAG
jgi:signal transduction histidine kinase